MQFIRTTPNFPFSSAVIYQGRVLETVLTGIPPGGSRPVDGGVTAEFEEIFRQLDAILAEAGTDRKAIVSARLYLEDINGEIGAANEVWKAYFGAHPPNRRAYGVALQAGMRIEAAFTAELP